MDYELISVADTNLRPDRAEKVIFDLIKKRLDQSPASTPEDLLVVLADYVTNEHLLELLAAYVASDNMSTILAEYQTSGNLLEVLSDYVTSENLTDSLSTYTTNDALSTLLSSYAQTTDLPDTSIFLKSKVAVAPRKIVGLAYFQVWSRSFPALVRPPEPDRGRLVIRNVGTNMVNVVVPGRIQTDYNSPGWTGAVFVGPGQELVADGVSSDIFIGPEIDTQVIKVRVYAEIGY